jgi:beta-glucosidase
VRELRAFQRVHLKPRQSKTVQFTLATDDLAFYNAQGALAAEPGDFHLWIAPDSAAGLQADFTLAP